MGSGGGHHNRWPVRALFSSRTKKSARAEGPGGQPHSTRARWYLAFFVPYLFVEEVGPINRLLVQL